MKKTILASAIAAATFSGAAFAQNPDLSASELAAKMDSMPTIYGNIQYVVLHEDYKGGSSSIEHADNGSTLGVKHDHQIAPGLTGFFKVELEGINADDKSSSNGIDGLDEAYIGVDSDQFGRVWIGSDDSTYETAIDKIGNFYEVGAYNISAGGYDTGEGDLIQYKSPSFGGLTLAAAVQVNGDNDTKATETLEGNLRVYNEDGTSFETVPVEVESADGDKSYPYQLAAMFEVDALELAVAMDSNDGSNGDNENTYGLRATYNMDNLSLTGQFQTRKDDADVFGAHGVYTLGANQFSLAYEYVSFDKGQNGPQPGSPDVATNITLQALHNLSDNMYVYAEGYIGGGDELYAIDEDAGVYTDERSIAAVGAVYYF